MNSDTRTRTRPVIRAAATAARSELRLDRVKKARARLAEGFYDDPVIDEKVGLILAELLGN